MSRNPRSVLRIAGLALLLVGCDSGDASDMLLDPVAPHLSAPDAAQIGTTSNSSDLEKAYAISEPYYFIDPLAPFGVGYEEFGADLELVTDQQFTNWGEANYSSIQADTTEDDALTVLEYTRSGGSGVSDPIFVQHERFVTTSSMGRCEDQYDNNCKRCRKIRSRKGRAVCWAGAMAVYAGCIGLEKIQ